MRDRLLLQQGFWYGRYGNWSADVAYCAVFTQTCSALAFLQRNDFFSHWFTDVFAERPIKPVVFQLLEYMGAPARTAGNGKYRRKQIGWNSERVINRRGIEIDVGVQVFLFLHQLGYSL